MPEYVQQYFVTVAESHEQKEKHKLRLKCGTYLLY